MINRLAVCVVWCVLGSVIGLAMAADACGGEAWPYGLGHYPYSIYPYYAPIPLRADQPIPYYAVHPPVYYSHIVPRPYGYSPYAYVPGIVTPQSELWGPSRRCPLGYVQSQDRARKWHAPPPGPSRDQEAAKPNRQAASRALSPGPVLVNNAYFSGESAPEPTGRAAGTVPQRITNPYCVGLSLVESGVSEGMCDDHRGTPQIVFPLAAAEAPE
jgi:hypothetical protein